MVYSLVVKKKFPPIVWEKKIHNSLLLYKNLGSNEICFFSVTSKKFTVSHTVLTDTEL